MTHPRTIMKFISPAFAFLIILVTASGSQAQPFAYVVNSNGGGGGWGTVSVINTATNTVVATFDGVGTNPAPHAIAFNAAGTRAYLTNSGGGALGNTPGNSVSVINTANLSVVATIPVGRQPERIVVNAAGTRAYVANIASNSVSVIDTAANSVLATVPVGSLPIGVAINAAGTRVYVTNLSSNNVSVIDTASNTVVATVALAAAGPREIAVNPAGTRAYVANINLNTVAVIDTTSNAVIATVPVGNAPYAIAVSPDGARAYVGHDSRGDLTVIDTASNTVVATAPLGLLAQSGTLGVAVSTDGTRVYATHYLGPDPKVSVIDPIGNTVFATVPVGVAPYGIAINPTANPMVPGAPIIGAATSGAQSATVSFTPPAFDGGSPITGYAATCNPGNVTATGSGSPITITGLVNGTPYDCSVRASNSAGTGAASATVGVTPFAPELTGVFSRKMHGAAGPFDLPIDTSQPLNGLVTVEPRAADTGHQIVFRFNFQVTAPGTASVSPAGTAAVSFSANEVVVNLTNIPDNQRVTVSLVNVDGVFTPSPVSLGFLLGDVSNSRAIDAADLSAIKARSGQTVSQTNYGYDLSLSGVITASDIAAIKARLPAGAILADPNTAPR